MVESEFPVDWSLEVPNNQTEVLGDTSFISRQYLAFITDLIKKERPDFVVEDKGIRPFEETIGDDEFVKIFSEDGIPYSFVDIPEYALNYISLPLTNKKELIEKFDVEIKNYKEKRTVYFNDPHFQQLVVWKQYLKDEYKEEENEIRYKVREAWMMMGILKFAKSFDKRHLLALFICDKRHFEGIFFLAKELDIECEIINIKKISKNFNEATSVSGIMKKSVIEIMPIKIKKKPIEEKILYFFDTDDYCSPFDINMGYDAGFDVVLPFSKMTADRVGKLVQDAMFSRRVGAPTVYFVGGSNVEESDKIADTVLNALVPPFESPVIIDPRGAHTTASAIVAKTIEIARMHKINDLANKKLVILGGTGPVGQICALIGSKLQAKVYLTSRREKAVKSIAKELMKKAGKGASQINGVVAITDEEKFEVLKDADIIWSVGKAGIQLVSKELMKRLPSKKIVVDLNLVPPYGIEGIKPNFNNEEFCPGIYGIGALDIGRLKYKIENKILKEATTRKGKVIFDYNFAFRYAVKIKLGSEIEIIY
ncbi:hypothetical protein ES705_12465 [subsurface metagenome]